MKEEIEGLYKKYGPMVLRRCRSILGDEHLAHDAMQDVFIRFIEKRDSLTLDYPSSLLYTIATRICLNIIRSQKRRPAIPNGELLLNIATAEDVESNVWHKEMLGRIFNLVEPSTRVIAVMHFVDKLTWEEIAKANNLSISGVRKRIRILQEKVAILKNENIL